MAKRIQKRSVIRKKRSAAEPVNQLATVEDKVPTAPREVRFTAFQVVPEPDNNPWIVGLGVDGALYLYNWDREVWLQCPLEYKTDAEVVAMMRPTPAGVV